jgi:hypothetical protein
MDTKKNKLIRLRPTLRLDPWPVFDLDLIQKGFRESLLVARLFAKPGKYLRPRKRRRPVGRGVPRV